MKILLIILVITSCNVTSKDPETVIKNYQPLTFEERRDGDKTVKALNNRTRIYVMDLCDTLNYSISIPKNLTYKKHFTILRLLLDSSEKAESIKSSSSITKLSESDKESLLSTCRRFNQIVNI